MPGREFLLLVVEGNAGGKQLELAVQKLLDMVSVDLGEGDEPLHISARVGISLVANRARTATRLRSEQRRRSPKPIRARANAML